MIRFGPAGLGGVKEALTNLESYAKNKLGACEIAFTYGVYLNEEQAIQIGDKAKELGVRLSIHAPYWINLNSSDKDKINKSKERILDCCRIGHFLQASCVVFHAGFYGKVEREKCYGNIKQAIIEILEEIKKNKWNIKIAPETMGKINVFGSIEDILKLVKETGCGFCIDFAHLYARRTGKMSYKETYDYAKEFKELHCHFSGINFGDKGEKNHELTSKIEAKKLLEALPRNKDITIINESPFSIKDAEMMKEVWEKI
jgi:deoxyribonuclease-4